MTKLFEKYEVKNLSLRNRIVMAPMCMFCADANGNPNEFHYVHYVSRAMGGVGLIILEATGVSQNGRITDKDLGIWDDSHIPGLKRMVAEMKRNGASVGIQLGHAGRKCTVEGVEILAPSAYHDSQYQTPKEMSIEDINQVKNDFKEAARRSLEIGFDTIELHGAHGYLINQFLSPIINKRTDQYGGSLENRARFLLEVIDSVKEVWPSDRALMVRVSAEEYHEDGNHIEDLVKVSQMIKEKGVDIIDVSSGGVVTVDINTYPGYQVNFAQEIKEKANIPTIAGGMVLNPEMAEEIVNNKRADLVFLGRPLLSDPYWVLHAAKTLNADFEWPQPYKRAVK